MLNFIVWKWRDPLYAIKYDAHHVNTMASMLSRHVTQPYRLICITDDPSGIECETFPLWTDFADMKNESWKDLPMREQKVFPSCYRRLKIFSAETTRSMGIEDGEKVISLDLDMVITDNIDSLFTREENFVGWLAEKGSGDPARKRAPCFNGSLWMFKAGTCEFLWDEFDPLRSPEEVRKADFYGSDQGWFSYRMFAHNPHWTITDGVRRYFPSLRQNGATLIEGTRMAIFCGRWKPWEEETIAHSPWISAHYH